MPIFKNESPFKGEKEAALSGLNPEQQADYQLAMDAMKGLSPYQAAQALSTLGGTDYRGCPKWHMAKSFATRNELFSRGLRGRSIECVRRVMDAKRAKIGRSASTKGGEA